MKKPFLALISILLASFTLLSQHRIDFDRITGEIKPVNGVGQPPIYSYDNTSMFHYLKEAGIPYSRLHDVGGPYGMNIYVDIPNVFRDFDADENDPASYDFAFTDILMKGLADNGVEPYYRLGVTIENAQYVKAYRIFPPKDYAKWARICEHIIMHYNEGWADGFHMGVSHWEIWNEPENGRLEYKENMMWAGTWEQYMDLYGTVAPYLKARFPHLKIGGYGSSGFYAIDGKGVKAANVSPRFEYFVDCFLEFLERARKEKWPLDFFSAHSYADPATAVRQMEYARKTLDKYGFKDTELSVNEWLPEPGMEKLNTVQQAAEIAAEMIGFQNSRVDDAEIYDAKVRDGMYAPLFDCLTFKPRKAYYTYLMFNELRKLGKAVALPKTDEGIYLCGAADGNGKAALMVSNISGKSWKMNFSFGKYKVTEVRLLDDGHLNDTIDSVPGFLGNWSVCLLLLEKGSGDSQPSDNPDTGMLILSFDDRNFNDWINALPLFGKYGAHATFFFSGPIDDEASSTMKTLSEAGHSIGLHGFRHANADEELTVKSADEFYDEEIRPQLDECRVKGIPVSSYAYPNCRRTDESDALLKQWGFRHIRGGHSGVAPFDPDDGKQKGLKPLHKVDRIFFPASESPLRYRLDTVIAGEAYHTDINDILACIRRAARRKEAFVLTSHGISPDAKFINMKTEWLEKILATARESGLRIVGFDELQ